MKYLLTWFWFSLFSPILFGQNLPAPFPPTLEIQFSTSTYQNTNPKNIHGLGIVFTKPFSRHFDYRFNLNGSYADSISQKQPINSQKSLMLQADITIRARMLSERTKIQPYALAGLGIAKYQSYYQPYAPAGLGIFVSIFNDVYLVSSAQYRLPLSDKLNGHFFYSIGIAGTIGKRKAPPATAAKKIVPPLSVVTVRDSDNDGIVDTADACPSIAGLARFQGCPDSDNDNIPDNNDKCPNIPGIAKYTGCPVPDSDKDGINDEEDKCVAIPGVIKYAGCPIPDHDSDGINDEEDKCPAVPGLKENAGCPPITKQLVETANNTARNIYFKTGSAQLLPESHLHLDKFVQLLSQNPNTKLSIEGHTDNSGLAEANEVLSQNRSQSVLQYLKMRGISEDRMTAKGFGQRKPIADNGSVEGRAENRRVELILSY